MYTAKDLVLAVGQIEKVCDRVNAIELGKVEVTSQRWEANIKVTDGWLLVTNDNPFRAVAHISSSTTVCYATPTQVFVSRNVRLLNIQQVYVNLVCCSLSGKYTEEYNVIFENPS
jgi:hypothetical protein